MKAAVLTQALLSAAEKASRIARKIRANTSLLSMLVQEKGEAEKNPKFVHDFKTLADVLIQEVTKYDLAVRFPSLKGRVFGEEDCTFGSSADGLAYSLEISADQRATAVALALILQDEASAAALAAAAHETVHFEMPDALQHLDVELNEDDVAVWIDPIDSTEQYILGIESPAVTEGIFTKGLQCVTVLIGAFSRSSGKPIVGVAVRPFEHQLPDGQWHGAPIWGIAHSDVTLSSVTLARTAEKDEPTSRQLVAVVGSTELAGGDSGGGDASTSAAASGSSSSSSLLLRKGWLCVRASGAGNKLLAVVCGSADVFFCRSPTVFEWDACGVHAVLRSVGGGIVDYAVALEAAAAHCRAGGSMATVPFEGCQIGYRSKGSQLESSDGGGGDGCKYCLENGLVAYRTRAHLEAFFSVVLHK